MPVPDHNVPHEQAVDDAIDAQMRRTSNQAAITDLPAASASYVQAEASGTRTVLNQVLQVLRDAELIP